MPKESGKKLISQNRKARHDYFVDETYEAGIALSGTEVKSIRAGAVNLKDSYCRVEDGELWASGIHVSPYEKGSIFNVDPLRDRKLLMHKREIMKLGGLCARAVGVSVRLTRQGGARLVPRKEAVRQARGRREEAGGTRDRARDEGKVKVIYGGVMVSTGIMKCDKRAETGQSL